MGMFIPQLAVSIFTTHEELVNISAKGLRIVVMFFPIVGFQMVTSNFFQSIGMASKAIFLSVSRQVLILIPCLLILPQFYGQLGVWISMPISDLIASLIAGTMLWWQFKQFRKVSVWRAYCDTPWERCRHTPFTHRCIFRSYYNIIEWHQWLHVSFRFKWVSLQINKQIATNNKLFRLFISDNLQIEQYFVYINLSPLVCLGYFCNN